MCSMQWTDRIRQVKIWLVVSAVIIAVASLVVSHTLVSDLKREESSRMEVWAEAMRSLNQADEQTDLSLVLSVINGNSTIPVVVIDEEGRVQEHRNIEPERAESLAVAGKVIAVDSWRVCYDDSLMLRRLELYPYVQLGVVLIFVVVAIFALLSSKRAEQNKVWVGLSKETAHQLGTPISSLMAWVEVLRESYPTDPLIPEMSGDVKRLERVAERFSKIGSLPEVRCTQLGELLDSVVRYMSHRVGAGVAITSHVSEPSLSAMLNGPLFEWVIENLCKNAVDAMEGRGRIDISATQEGETVVIEVSDTGKGIPAKHLRSVFMPGFTTKQRGWGLGLSLAKRIVEEYHHGRIFVKQSELGRGPTFRIELRG